MSEGMSAWKKFYHPLSVWRVLLVFVVANLVVTFIFVAMREGLGLNVPHWPIGGIAAVVGLLVVNRMVQAARRRSDEAAPPPAT